MNRDWAVIPVQDEQIDYEWRGWHVTASWPRRGGRTEVSTTLSVRYTGVGGGNVVSRRRINILSSSAINAVLANMNKVDGADRAEIMFFMNDVFEDVLKWYEQGKLAERPDPRKVKDTVAWFMYPIWPAAGVTGVAAAPGSYKSFIAEAIALSLAHGTPLLTKNTRVKEARHILYLDWEADADTFARRLGALQDASGLPVEDKLVYKQMTTRLADSTVGLRELIVEEEFDGVVVDSMSASIGAGMVDDDAVNGFYDAIHQLAVPALVLAHKSVANQQNRKARFFGSGMSEARVRMAWNAEVTDDGNFVLWECFKDNNHGLRGSKLAWEVEMESSGEKDERHLSRVAFTGTNPENVMLDDNGGGAGGGLSSAERLSALYTVQGPQATKDAARALATSVSNIRQIHSRNSDKFVPLDDGRWTTVGT